MTREEVIAMVREAGLNDWMVFGRIEPEENILMRFAAAVATHEREACTKIFKELEQKDEHIAEVIEAAVQAEREAFPDLGPVIAWLENGCDPREAAKELRMYAEAIKARGTA